MARRTVSSGSPYEAPIGFSRAVRIGDTIAVAGTGPIAEDGSTAAPRDPYGQAKRCLDIIEAAIAEAGGGLQDVIRTRVYLTDASVWEEVGRAHGEVFGEIKPVCTFVEVSALLREDWVVEIEADAVVSR
ncbi:MAG: RidA family protein [Pseudomonadota bacterium]